MGKNTGKWIGGILGWAIGGPIGALFGVGIGSMFDGSKSLFQTNTASSGARNSFMMSLLVLSAAVMKADQRVMRSELEFVKEFLRRNFGPAAVPEGLALLKDLLGKEIRVEEVSTQIALHMPVSQRLQLFHYLCGIAWSDGMMDPAELALLRQIALLMRLPAADVEEDVLDLEELACRLMQLLWTRYPEAIKERYGVAGVEEDCQFPGYELLLQAGRKRGFLMRGNEINTERMAKVLVDEYRSGKLGRFTLEMPEAEV